MNVRVGDFWIISLIENPGERKKTISGRPNILLQKFSLIPSIDTALRSIRGLLELSSTHWSLDVPHSKQKR